MTKQEYISKEYVLTPYQVEKMLLEFFNDILSRSPDIEVCQSEEQQCQYAAMWLIGYLETIELLKD